MNHATHDMRETGHAPAAATHDPGQQHPIGIYLKIWGLLFVLSAHSVRSKVVSGKASKEPSARRQKLRAQFDKYGVAGVSLLGQTILPSQITSAAMVSFGASKNAVILWQIVSIILWGVAFGVFASLGVSLIG